MSDSIGGLNHVETFASQARATAAASELRDAESAASDGRGAEAEKALEGLFTKMLVKEMRKGLGEGFFGSGPGADTYAEWFDDHLAESLAEGGALDLGPLLEEFRATQVQASDEEETTAEDTETNL